MEQHLEQLAIAETWDNGKPIRETMAADLPLAIDHFRYFAGCARAHLTTTRKNNPLEPPALCMLMRKHITGGRVCGIRALECDRILEVEIEHHDELGDTVRKRIICEFMGKHSNIIFVGGDGRIIEVQGTAEKTPFSQDEFLNLMALAKKGIARLVDLQKMAVA